MRFKRPKLNKKTKAFVKTLVPSLKEIAFFCKLGFVLSIILTFIYLFQYSGYQLHANAQSGEYGQGDAISGGLNYIPNVLLPPLIGCGGSQLSKSVGGADQRQNLLCNPEATNTTETDADGNKVNLMVPIDLGATGRLINSTSYLYDEDIAVPGETVQYYANKLRGTAYADSATSGREVLTPMFKLNYTLKNIAYGLIVILLVVSSMSILIGYLSGAEQKLSLVQLMINCGFSLFFITFFYEIAAIIYDLTVNYGNTIVASAMEPFINAHFILDRLGPGGDLNVTALVNAYQFSGVSEGIITVTNNIFMGLTPAITQTVDGFSRNALNDLPLNIGKIIGAINGFAGGGVSYGASTLISSLLGSQAIFNAIIAFVFFTINFKIWGNLLFAFIKFNLYVAFGPLLMLSAVGKGYDEIKNTFKTLVKHGLTFPLTFLFILLGATMMNFFIRSGAAGQEGLGDAIKGDVLCIYSSQDPTADELEDTFARRSVGVHTGIGSESDPRAFKRNWTDFQDIYDVKADTVTDGTVTKRDCRSSLFPTPFAFLPAPLGNYGNRLMQIQTTDSLIRTVLAIAFLVMATRVPQILEETLQVKEASWSQNMGAVFGGSISAVLGVAGLAFSAAPTIALKGMGYAANKKIPPWLGGAWLSNNRGLLRKGGDYLAPKQQTVSLAETLGFLRGNFDAQEAYKGIHPRLRPVRGGVTNGIPTHTTPVPSAGGAAAGAGAGGGVPGYFSSFGQYPGVGQGTAVGMSDMEQAIFTGVYLAQNFDKLAGTTNSVVEVFNGLAGAVKIVEEQMTQLGGNLKNLAGLTAITDKI
jgi:hypothetical protein